MLWRYFIVMSRGLTNHIAAPLPYTNNELIYYNQIGYIFAYGYMIMIDYIIRFFGCLMGEANKLRVVV